MAMGYASLAASIVKLINLAMSWMKDRQLIQAGEDKNALASLKEEKDRIKAGRDARGSVGDHLYTDDPYNRD